MMHAFFISWHYQRSKQKNRLVTLISTFSSIGIALGVAVLILGLSAMNGFERELNNRILAVVPQVEVMAYSDENGQQTLHNWQALQQRLLDHPDIVGIAPFVRFTALVENGSKLKVVEVKGVEKSFQDQVSQLGRFVLNNQWKNFNSTSGVILGYGIAKELNVQEGDWVSLLISQRNGEQQLSQPVRHRVQVSGVLRLEGLLDHSYALLPLERAQQFLNLLPEQANGIELKVSQPFEVQKIQYPSLQDYPQSLYAKHWIAKFGYMYKDIQLIRTVMYIAMVLVIGVACFNIISTLIMAVKDKQGDIAIMRTLGANNRFVKQIFIWYGLQAGMKGCLIGILLGIILALNLTPIMQGLESLLGVKFLSDGIYFVDFLPSELHWQDVLLVFISALILSLIASLYPANRAAKLAPAQVLNGH